MKGKRKWHTVAKPLLAVAVTALVLLDPRAAVLLPRATEAVESVLL